MVLKADLVHLRVRAGIRSVCFTKLFNIAAGDGEAICSVLSLHDTKDFIWLGLPQAVTGVLLSFTIAPLKYK